MSRWQIDWLDGEYWNLYSVYDSKEEAEKEEKRLILLGYEIQLRKVN